MIPRKEETIFKISEKEIEVLKELLKVLKEERDFIVSFSVEGIIECNNKKESLLKKLEFIDSERTKLMEGLTEYEKERVIERLKAMKDTYLSLVEEVKTQMEKNMGLLSFSMDNIKGIIETIVGYLNKNVEYAKGRMKRDSLPLLFSREV